MNLARYPEGTKIVPHHKRGAGDNYTMQRFIDTHSGEPVVEFFKRYGYLIITRCSDDFRNNHEYVVVVDSKPRCFKEDDFVLYQEKRRSL